MEDASLVLLVSDGVADQVPPEVFARLCREHAADPQSAWVALVDGADSVAGFA
ncbi:hypothetical protein ACWD3J_46895 [Streptomyces sp. NPDC002755]